MGKEGRCWASVSDPTSKGVVELEPPENFKAHYTLASTAAHGL
jgi:hypothetical protein